MMCKLFKSSIAEEDITEDLTIARFDLANRIPRKHPENNQNTEIPEEKSSEKNESNSKNDRFARKPKISRAGSVDYGLSVENREARNKIKRRRAKARIQKKYFY